MVIQMVTNAPYTEVQCLWWAQQASAYARASGPQGSRFAEVMPLSLAWQVV